MILIMQFSVKCPKDNVFVTCSKCDGVPNGYYDYGKKCEHYEYWTLDGIKCLWNKSNPVNLVSQYSLWCPKIRDFVLLEKCCGLRVSKFPSFFIEKIIEPCDYCQELENISGFLRIKCGYNSTGDNKSV
ncbi:MAG: hypothetical protein V1701_02695 [Planctomycetota bacterium]